MSKRTVELLHEPSDAVSAPLLVSFRGGPPQANSVFNCKVYEQSAKKKRIVVADTEKVTYQAANFGHGNASNDLSGYVVGVVDKETNVVQLFNVDQLYVMQQSVKGFRENIDENKQESLSYADRQKNLVDVFGSKASKRIVKNREENKIQIENIRSANSITQIFNDKVQENTTNLAAKKAKDPKYSADGHAMDETRLAMLPPCNFDALSPDSVYDLSNFLDSDIMESLKMKADEFIDTLSTTTLSELVTFNNIPAPNYVGQVMTSMGKPYDLDNIALMLYVMYLVQFYHARYPLVDTPGGISESMNIPHIVVKQILETFTEEHNSHMDSTRYNQSKFLKDKLLLYILVVTMTIGNFSLELSAISADLKRTPVNVSMFAKQIGCRIDKIKMESSGLGGKKSEGYRAVLALPLQFPSAKKGASKRLMSLQRKKRRWPWKHTYNRRIASVNTIVTSISINHRIESLQKIPVKSLKRKLRPWGIQRIKDFFWFDQWPTNFSSSGMDLLSNSVVISSDFSWENIKNHKVFDPSSKAITKWNTILLIIVIYDSFIIPFLIAVQIAHHDMCKYDGYYISMNVFEILFLLDIYIRFHTGYYLNGDLVQEVKATSKKYFYSRKFVLDLIALIPFSFFSNMPLHDTICGLFHLNKLIRLHRIGQYLIDFDIVFARYFKFCKMVKVIVALCVFCHYCGSIYILFGFDMRPHDIEVEPWKLSGHLIHETIEMQYLASVVWVLGITSKCSEGGIPETLYETLFMVLVMFGGFLLFIYICGTLFMISKCDSDHQERFDAITNQLRYVLSFHRVPLAIQESAIEFLENEFKSGENQDRSNMKLLCPSIAKDLKYYTLKRMVTDVPFFRNCSSPFIRALVDLMETQPLPTNYYVCQEGDDGEDMYFVQSGVLAVTIHAIKVRELRKGGFFGELSLFCNQRRTACVMTATFCILQRLTRAHVTRVLNAYPELEVTIMECVAKISEELTTKTDDENSETIRRGSVIYTDTLKKTTRKNPSLRTTIFTHSIAENTTNDGIEYKTENLSTISSSHEIWYFRLLLLNPIDRKSNIRMYWLIIIMSITLYNVFIIPLLNTFEFIEYPIAIYILNGLTDIFLLVDIYGKFNLSYINDGEEINTTSSCAKHYYQTSFWFDIIAAAPWWILSPLNHIPLSCIRLIRCVNFQNEMKELATFIRITSKLRLIILGIGLFLSFHLAGCLAHACTRFAGYGDDEYGWLPPNTLEIRKAIDNSTGELVGYLLHNGTLLEPHAPEIRYIFLLQYARALQYGAVCMSNLGRTLEPQKIWEYPLAFGFMLSGMIIISIIIDEVQKRVTASAIEQVEFLSTRSRILHFLDKQKIPKEMHRRVLQFLDFSWSAHCGANINQILNQLPSTIQRDIYGYICASMLEVIAHFDHIHDSIDQISNIYLDNVTIQLYGQDEMIYCSGDIADNLYILIEGDVSTFIAARGDSKMNDIARGEFFGLSSLDFTNLNTAHGDTAIARSACVVAITPRRILNELNQIYPRFTINLQKQSKKTGRMTSRSILKKIKEQSPKPIDPDSTIALLWETSLFFGIIFQCISVPYYMAFGFSISSVAFADGFSIFLEICFLFDIYFKSRTGYIHYGNKIMDIPSIRKRYFKSISFFIDFLAVIPLNLVNLFLTSPRTEAWNINKLLRLFKLSSQLAHLERQFFTINIHIRLFKLIFYTFFLSHFVGSAWFNFASNKCTIIGLLETRDFGIDMWVPDKSMSLLNSNMTSIERYTKTLYWGLGLLLGFSTGGFPKVVSEYFFTILIQIVGVFLLAYVVGNLLDIAQVLDGNHRMLYSNLMYVRKLLQYFNFSNEIEENIKYFYFYRIFHSIHEEHILVQHLPPSLTADIRMELLKPMLLKVPFLKNEIASSNIIRILVSQMSQMLISRGEIIYRQYDLGFDMYFVFSGCLEVFIATTATRYENQLGKKVNEIHEGAFFGENSLFTNTPRKSSIQAKTFCTLYKLSHRHVQSVFTWHPKWKKIVMEIVHQIYEKRDQMNEKSEITSKIPSSDSTEMISKNPTMSLPYIPVKFSILKKLKWSNRIYLKYLKYFYKYLNPILHVPKQSIIYQRYLILLSGCFIYISLSIPYMLTLGEEGLGDIGYFFILFGNLFTDGIFIYDIWFKKHLIETNKTKEFYEYHDRTNINSWLDIIAIIPIDYFCSKYSTLSNIFRLNRFIKLRQLPHSIREINRFNMHYEINQLKLLTFYYLIICYWTACAYFSFTFLNGFADEDHSFLPIHTFQVHGNDTAELFFHRLLRCLYFSATIYTGAGLIHDPDTILEYSFVIIMTVFGVFVMGYVLGEASTLCIYLIQNEVDFKINQMNVMEFLARKHLSHLLENRVHLYMAYWWSTHQGISYQTILEQLPRQIRSQASLQVARLSLSRFTMRYIRPMAKDVAGHDAIIHSIAARVNFEGYPKGESVIVQGNIGQTMYFVSKGELTSTSTQVLFQSTRYSEGQYFGEEGFLGATVCHFSVIATRSCDLLSLSAPDFINALEENPRFAEGLSIARDATENVLYVSMCANDAGEEVIRQTIEEQAVSLNHFSGLSSEKCSVVFGQFVKLFVSSHTIKGVHRTASKKVSKRTQLSCQKCWKRLAALHCIECNSNYCHPCSLTVHGQGDSVIHNTKIRTVELYTSNQTANSAMFSSRSDPKLAKIPNP